MDSVCHYSFPTVHPNIATESTDKQKGQGGGISGSSSSLRKPTSPLLDQDLAQKKHSSSASTNPSQTNELYPTHSHYKLSALFPFIPPSLDQREATAKAGRGKQRAGEIARSEEGHRFAAEGARFH